MSTLFTLYTVHCTFNTLHTRLSHGNCRYKRPDHLFPTVHAGCAMLYTVLISYH